MKKLVIYHDYIPLLGGIESAVYNLAKQLGKNKYKVTILYNSAESIDSLFRYATVADVVRITSELELKCDVALIASNHRIPKQLIAKKYLQWIHSDYDRYKLDLDNIPVYKEGKLKYVSVSKHARDVIKRREDIDSDVIYNLLDEDFGKDERRVLRLVTNSRISPEKGFGRMLQFAELLKKEGVRFVWTVFGDNSHFPKEFTDVKRDFSHIQEVSFVGYKSDIAVGLTNADYLIQLSDFEGCPLAILEALKMEVPCIVTNWNGVQELIQDGKNGYILKMKNKDVPKSGLDLKSIDIDKIVNKIPEFKYKPKSTVQEWIKLIEK